MSALTTWLTAIADAIRGKDGTALPIDHADFPGRITAIATGNDTSDATALESHILAPKTAYISTGKVTGTCTFDADTSDADAVESDILLGKTAYAGGVKKTGTSTLNADTTGATLTANDMLYGVTGYGADGTKLTGTGAKWELLRGFSFASDTLIGAVTIYAPALTSQSASFAGQIRMTTLTMTIPATGIASWRDAFNGCNALTTITNPIDFTSSTDFLRAFSSCNALKEIRIVQSTIKASLTMANSSLLSNASLLSIANGLYAESATKTLTMPATAKTNMDAIMVDNNAGVAEPGSTMTLTAFINNIKGWTIA